MTSLTIHAGPSEPRDGFLVMDDIEGARHPIDDYPLIQGDLLVKQEDGTYFKVCPGISLGGFRISEYALRYGLVKPVKYRQRHLEYQIIE